MNGEREHIHKYFMDIAYKVASRSTCIKRKVGAIIVKDDNIISIGWNHSPFQLCNENNCIKNDLGKGIACGHAEAFAIIGCTPEQRKNATMYLTLYPCTGCQLLLMASGISKVIYDEEHPPLYDWIRANSDIKCINLKEVIG